MAVLSRFDGYPIVILDLRSRTHLHVLTTTRGLMHISYSLVILPGKSGKGKSGSVSVFNQMNNTPNFKSYSYDYQRMLRSVLPSVFHEEILVGVFRNC